MGLKSKPDLGFQAGKQLDEWRTKEPEAAETESHQNYSDPARNQRITKTLRMAIRHSEFLREEAQKDTRVLGRKVSEADILEEALDLLVKKRLS